MEGMVPTEDTTTARGPLRLRLRLMLSQPPLLSPAMVITEDITLTDTDTLLLMPTDIIIMARGLLMPSQDTGTMAMDMEAIVEDTMGMAMVMGTDTTVEKFQKFMLIQSD